LDLENLNILSKTLKNFSQNKHLNSSRFLRKN